MTRLFPKHIIITGASSGLGAALANAYAMQGVVLGLLGRDAERLDAVAHACHARGAQVQTALIDVRDAQAMRDWIVSFDAAYPVDLVIANAGVSAGLGEFGEGEAQVRAIFDVNIGGVINSVWPLAAHMAARGRGHIAVMSSLAGIRALPSAPAYSASKACVRYYAEALRGQLKASGVKVSVICPGYIDTPMTRINTFPMPFLMRDDRAAKRIMHALSCGKRRICFPRRLYYPLYLLACLPPFLTDWFFDGLPSKPHIS